MFFYSYDMKDPVYAIGGWHLSFQIFTLENIYGLDPAFCTLHTAGNKSTLACSKLSWAGQQQREEGSLIVEAIREVDGAIRIKAIASMLKKIKSVKILVRNLPPIGSVQAGPMKQAVPSEGVVLHYPSYDCRMPILAVYPETREGMDPACPDVIGFSSEDKQVRAKRFAVYPESELWGDKDRYVVELIHEEDATAIANRLGTPWWKIESDSIYDKLAARRVAHCEREFGWKTWQERKDVPDWMKRISLCVTLHGAHWSGYVFNTYDDMLDILQFVAERIEPERVLVYLPGWEGRYYWDYGRYQPSPLLGGEAGFAKLCRQAKRLGFHLMPMVGGNCVNAWLPGFEAFGPDAYLKSATRNRNHGNAPDWNQDRSHDTGWQAWLNPGHPSWQRELAEQVLELANKYEWDGIFLDTIHAWTNDPDHSVFAGISGLAARLRAGKSDFLVAAESWWDGMLSVIPLFQNDELNRPLTPHWFKTYARTFDFLGLGEPSRSSGGVQHYRRMPSLGADIEEEEAHIPSIAFVGDTLKLAQEAVEEAIQAGRQYAARFFS